MEKKFVIKQKIINFCKNNDIRHFEVNIKLQKITKTINNKNYIKLEKKVGPYNDLSYPKIDYLTGNEEQYNSMKKYKNCNYIWVDTREYLHIDVDFVVWKTYSDESKEFVNSLIKKKLPYFKSKTKPLGYHFIIKINDLPENFKNYKIETKFDDIEILNKCGSWINKDTLIVNSKNNNIIDLEEFKTYFKDNELPLEPAKIIEDEGIVTDNEIKNSRLEIIDMLRIIDIKYIDDYHSWTKIIWGLRNNSINNKDLAQKFSSKSDNYDRDGFYKIWTNTRSGNGIGSVYHYARLSNPEEFKKIKSKYMSVKPNLGSDDSLAKLFLDDNKLNYVYQNNILYTYHNKIWAIDYQNNKLSRYVPKYLFELLNIKLSELNKKISNDDSDAEEKRKILNKIISSVLSSSKISNIIKSIIPLLACEDFKNIRFDENPFIFCFNNKCFDLKKKKWITPKREDYILTTTDYDYIKSDNIEEDKKKIDDLMIQIFPDEPVRKTYTHYMATSLFGQAVEKFIIANGGGGNGKGVLNELLCETLGNYAYTAPNEILLEPIKSGNNPAVANMNNKRLVLYREPPDNKKICGSAIKELCGGSEISARMNYSNNMKTLLKATHILECNKKPKIDGRIDDSFGRRLNDIPFKSTFTNNNELLDEKLDYVFKANSYYKTNDFKNKFKCVLFDYLIDYIKEFNNDICDNLYVCDEVLNRTKQYLQNSDDLYTVLSEKIEKSGDKKEYITIKDLFRIYKCSDYYLQLSKKQKREQNYGWLTTELSSNINFRVYYRDRVKINGKDIKNCLLGYKNKCVDNEFIEDDLD